MRSDKPRLAPLGDAEFNGELRATARRFLKDEYCDANVVRTIARAPQALGPFLTWAGYFLSTNNSLPPREREIVILRVAFLCKSDYEISHHVQIGLNAGVTLEEMARIKEGTQTGWSPADLALLRACDDLVTRHVISDEGWERSLRFFSERQALDVLLTASQYVQLAMIFNSVRLELDRGLSAELPIRSP